MQWPWSIITCTFITSAAHRLCPYLSSSIRSNLFSNYCPIANHQSSNDSIHHHHQQLDMPPPSMSTTTSTKDSTSKLSAQDKLVKLRAVMKQHSIQALYVPSEDAHSNEYISPSDARRAFISGFTGSAGTRQRHPPPSYPTFTN